MLSASGFSRREFEHTDAEIFGLLEVEDHVLEPHHVAQMGLVGELGIHRHRSTPMCLLGVRELVASCARSSPAPLEARTTSRRSGGVAMSCASRAKRKENRLSTPCSVRSKAYSSRRPLCGIPAESRRHS
jgi:hypothetical protein